MQSFASRTFRPAAYVFAMFWKLRFIAMLASLVLAPHLALAQPAISISPAEVPANTAVTLIISASGGFDLSNVDASQVIIHPADGISLLQAIPNPPNLRVDFSLEANATTGPRTLLIVRPGNIVASATFTVIGAIQPECPSGEACCRRNPTSGVCISCQAVCPRPFCGGNRQCCRADPNDTGRCLMCSQEGQSCPPPNH